MSAMGTGFLHGVSRSIWNFLVAMFGDFIGVRRCAVNYVVVFWRYGIGVSWGWGPGFVVMFSVFMIAFFSPVLILLRIRGLLGGFRGWSGFFTAETRQFLDTSEIARPLEKLAKSE